jgi:rRNA-processing protein EBP2
MVTKSKLKMALVAEKQVDFKKEHQKKMAKKARKEQKSKKPVAEEQEAGDEEEEEDEEGIRELMELDAQEGSGDEQRPTQVTASRPITKTISNIPQIDFAGIDDSDSDSSSGVEDHNGLEDEEMSDEEDIPLSDLEDLDDEDKEDMIPHQRLTINNTTALSTALRRIALPLKSLAFTDHQSLTTTEPVLIADVSDDLNRELAFYKQALDAVTEARALLKKEGAPFSRPTDYFAEMVKADEHMAKIKAKLVEAAAGKKAAAEARKQRDLKKFGKQVQVAKLQERQKEKTATMEKIKVLKRSKSPRESLFVSPFSSHSLLTTTPERQDGEAPAGTTEADLFDVELDNATSSKPERRDRSEKRNKRAKKDEKYGFGGKKRHAKSNDAHTTGDLTGFSSRKMKGQSRPGAAKARPGKARRAGKR